MFEKAKSDSDLLHGLKNGSEAAFNELYSRYYLSVYRVAFAVLGVAEDAEDAAEDFFVSLLRNPSTIDETKPFSPYAYSSAHNAALNILKYSRKNHDEFIEESKPSCEATAQSVSEETMRFLGSILNPDERSVYVLHIAYSFTFAEIGGMMGVSEDSASSRFLRAKTKIESSMGKPTDPN